MGDITHNFSRNCSKRFSGNDFVSEGSEMKCTEVFVSGFESTVSEKYLQQSFSALCRGVRSVKIAKDDHGNSLGYCTMCFYKLEDAERAVSVINNREINGKILRVKLRRNTEAQNEAPNKCVFVKGFGETLDNTKLEMYFEKYIGNVAKAEVEKFENGASKGYGKVEFYNCCDAVEAALKLNGREVHGNILTVESFKPKEERNRNVFVKGFEDTLSGDDDLRVLFEEFGKIVSAKVEKDDNGKPKGFGYVCFERCQDAETAISKMNGKKHGSKILEVAAHQTIEERQKEIKNRNLHVRNLHESVTEDELKGLFAPYGKISSVRVRSSPFRGINQGYICFKTSKEADNAVAKLHLYLYKGLKLKVSPHQPKPENTLKNELDDSTFQGLHFTNKTLQIKTCKKENNAYKSRSKSMGNLTKSSANLQTDARFDDGGKLPLGYSKSEVPSTETSTNISINSDLAYLTRKRTGGEKSPLNKIPGRTAANVQVYEGLDSSEDKIRFSESYIPSLTVVNSKNQDKNQKSTASGNLIKSSTNLQTRAQFDEGDKLPLGYIKREDSCTKTSTKSSTNSDLAQLTQKLTGGENSSLSKIQPQIAENFQVYENLDRLEDKIALSESYIPSHTVADSKNHDKNRKSTASEVRNLFEMPMAVPDLLAETRIGLLHSTSNSKERNSHNAAENTCLPCNAQSPPTVIPKEKINSRVQRPAKKVYLCGGNVKRS